MLRTLLWRKKILRFKSFLECLGLTHTDPDYYYFFIDMKVSWKKNKQQQQQQQQQQKHREMVIGLRKNHQYLVHEELGYRWLGGFVN